MIRRSLGYVALVLSVTAALAQDRVPVSSGVGSTVLLATNSIQLDRDVTVVSGDVVVNSASAGPFYGEAQLSLDRAASTPAGFIAAANSIDLDNQASIGGNAYFNALSSSGSIGGTQNSPLVLPVLASLPPVVDRQPGTLDVVVGDRAFREIEEGSYGHLSIGRDATVRFTGSGYTFASISAARGATLVFLQAAHVTVSGRLSLGTGGTIGTAAGSGLAAGSVAFQVHGINGTYGQLFETPSAVDIGTNSSVDANLFATAGSMVFGQNVDATGSFIAVDILAGRNCRFSLGSIWNLPPAARPQSVFTNGAAPLAITLRGSDPEGALLAFSIVTPPTAGSLGAIAQLTSDSASVTYTPAGAGNVGDSFVFRVSDGTNTADAVVTINPPRGDGGPPPTTVVARDGSYDVPQDETATLLLAGGAPDGVALTFTVLTGPAHGTLDALVAGSESPQRTATAVYTPDGNYTGPDSVTFEACGVIGAATVCSSGTIHINVLPQQFDPPDLVGNVEVQAYADEELLITLAGNSLRTTPNRLRLEPHAAILLPAAVAGNVADATGDGLGDNQNDLPGSTPLFMSAGVGSTGDGGSQGTKRIHIEFDIAGFAGGVGNLTSAHVVLPTHRGTIDSLDTKFFAIGSDGDGVLTLNDFESEGESMRGVVMSVPPVSELPVGSDGFFTFDVMGELKAAVASGHDHLVIQGRVDESLTSGRGLEVRTTATGNLDAFNVPSLELTTPGVTAPIIYTITSLPLYGVLVDTTNNPITSVPYVLAGSQVRYLPNTGFVGLDTFHFEANNGSLIDTALVAIKVVLGNCATDPRFCGNGRD